MTPLDTSEDTADSWSGQCWAASALHVLAALERFDLDAGLESEDFREKAVVALENLFCRAQSAERRLIAASAAMQLGWLLAVVGPTPGVTKERAFFAASAELSACSLDALHNAGAGTRGVEPLIVLTSRLLEGLSLCDLADAPTHIWHAMLVLCAPKIPATIARGAAALHPTPSLAAENMHVCARVRAQLASGGLQPDAGDARLRDLSFLEKRSPEHVETVTLAFGNTVSPSIVSRKAAVGWEIYVDVAGPSPGSVLQHEIARRKNRKYRRKHAYIDHVIINLHPTFPRPRRRVEDPPFVVPGGSWGVFEVHGSVTFRPPFAHIEVPIQFLLSHDEQGTHSFIDVQLARQQEEGVSADVGVAREDPAPGDAAPALPGGVKGRSNIRRKKAPPKKAVRQKSRPKKISARAKKKTTSARAKMKTAAKMPATTKMKTVTKMSATTKMKTAAKMPATTKMKTATKMPATTRMKTAAKMPATIKMKTATKMPATTKMKTVTKMPATTKMKTVA